MGLYKENSQEPSQNKGLNTWNDEEDKAHTAKRYPEISTVYNQ